MKTLIIIVALLFVAPAIAGDIIVRPMVPDFTPGDGFMEQGSIFNPYILTDPDTGREIGTMQADIPDFNPGNGLMEKGSYVNPYRIRLND